MNVLLIGGGGREHALAWKLKQSPLLEALYCAPGNAGIAEIADCVALDVADHAAVISFCKEQDIALVVIGPEAPLVAGLADDLEAAGVKVFGPSRAAAQLEGSKGFTKDLCAEYGIPTAAYRRFTDAGAAKAYVATQSLPIVVKADGLAAGKGVVIALTREEANAAIEDCFGGAFGAAGAEVVIEEFLAGEEASFFALVDGETALPLATAQDHKRAFDGDNGPNTGGMGAYSPAPIMTPALMRASDGADHHADRARHASARHEVQGRALCRADDRARSGEADRIQCPFRRPRGASADAAAEVRPAPCPARRGRRAPARRHARLARRCRALRGDGDKGYPGSYAKGSEIKGLDAAAQTRMCRCSTPVRDATARVSSPMAAACSASPRAARTFAKHRPAPMQPSTRSTGRAASAGATSASAPWDAERE